MRKRHYEGEPAKVRGEKKLGEQWVWHLVNFTNPEGKHVYYWTTIKRESVPEDKEGWWHKWSAEHEG